MPKKVSEILDLQKAFNEILREERQEQGFLPDIIHFLEARKYRPDLIKQIIQELNEDRYTAKDLVKIEVPKDSFFIRPGARPHFRDLVLYRALVDYIGIKADRKLSRFVFSYRYNLRRNEQFYWIDQWLKFENAFWVNFEKGFNYVVKTDITAFFANINVDILRNCVIAKLDNSEESGQIVDFLFNNLIRKWAEKELRKGFGIPQGGSASPVLANIFLAHLDDNFAGYKSIPYLRYSDDIRVLAKTKTDAKKALKSVINELRRIGLDLNEKKTQILTRSDVERELRDPRAQDMKTLRTILEVADSNLIRTVAKPLLNDLFKRSFDSSDAFADRHLRFAINCFIKAVCVRAPDTDPGKK